MRKILISSLVLNALLVSPAFAEAPAYTLIKEKSSIKFDAIQNGAPLEGQFRDFSADIHFDPDHLDQSSIVAEVATGSVVVADEDIQKNLLLPEWLSTQAFPKAVYKSTKISRMPMTDNYYAEGKLTVRGKTFPATLNFQLKNYGVRDIAEGYLTIRRLDFGIGQGQWAHDDVIKNEVRIEFRITADKK